MISTLRVDGMHERREFNSKTQETAASYQQSALLQIPGGISSFQALREELEISNTGEQLYRLRQRVALAQLYNDYTHAQADPSYISVPTAEPRALGEIFDGIPEKKKGNAAGFFRHQATVGNWHPLINSHTRSRPLLFLLVTGVPT
jgi:hypothetical protein